LLKSGEEKVRKYFLMFRDPTLLMKSELEYVKVSNLNIKSQYTIPITI
jgi:hypothetical protein